MRTLFHQSPDDLLNPVADDRRSLPAITPSRLKTKFSSKNIIFGTLGAIAIAGSILSSPSSASAYAGHEHPFYNLSSAHNNQDKANRLCLQILNQRLSVLPFTRALNGTWLRRGRVWHVWAHLNNRQCIANQ